MGKKILIVEDDIIHAPDLKVMLDLQRRCGYPFCAGSYIMLQQIKMVGRIYIIPRDRSRGIARKTIYKAIGPIWEANHMWLIIAIVILFVGFPIIYTTISVYLHIPLVIMLMGIIARGTSFSFRNYDAVADKMQLIDSRIFVFASLITPLFLGIIAGSIVAGRIDPGADSFAGAYIFSWLHWFSVVVGLFTVSIFAFLAAVYLIDEADSDWGRQFFISKAISSNIAAVVSGALVFIAAKAEGIPLMEWIFGNAYGIVAMAAASFSLVVLWYLLYHKKTRVLRVLAGFQVTMILVAITYSHFPDIVLLKNGATLSLMDAAKNNSIWALGWALLIGGIFILPSLFYLIYSFDVKKRETTPIQGNTGD